MRRRYKHLTRNDRLVIETMLRDKKTQREIADRIGVHESTISREIRRGRYEHLNSDYTTEMRYSPDIAHQKYRDNLKAKGPDLKIGNDIELADFLESRIANDGYSPGAVLGEIKQKGLVFRTTISKTTLYRYIDIGIFLSLTNKDLPVKGRRKKKYKKVRRQARAAAGESIEKRPEDIESREEFGHWEMDTVVGKRGESKNSLLVLTERKTREEILMKLSEHTAAQVCKSLDALEEKWGKMFAIVFKTITVDNGTEFSDCENMEKSTSGFGKRTKVYYCHPYSSYERGTNENQNRLVRRKIPKGTNFDDRTNEEIQNIEDWINNYPRRLFGYRTAQMLFDKEIAAIA